MTLLLALAPFARANPPAPTFVVHPIPTPDGPGLATTWSDPQGVPLGTVVAAGELGLSDGWLKWLTFSSWDTPMEVPLVLWDAGDCVVCREFTGSETEFSGTETEFSGTETELVPCRLRVEAALRDASLALLEDAGVVGPAATAAVEAQVAVVVAGLPAW